MKLLFIEVTEHFILRAVVSNDRLKLFLDVTLRGEAKAVTRTGLLNCLAIHIDTSRIISGVLEDIVRSFSENATEVRERKIVSGIPATAGSPERLELLVKSYSPLNRVRIDPKSVITNVSSRLFDNIHEGQVIGRLYTPGDGKDGYDVCGVVIPGRPGDNLALVLDPSIELVDPDERGVNYKNLVALETGYLAEHDGRLAIRTQFSIYEDLDYQYGNLDFIGEIHLKGDVMPGFNVKAKRGITIDGSVRGGSLIASEGHINVSGYIYGGPNSMILAGKSLTAWVVQEVNTEIIGDIFIGKEAQSSYLRTAGALFMPNGAMIGGEAFAVRGVEVRVIGSASGIATRVTLASDVEASMEYARLNVGIQVIDREIDLQKIKLGPYIDDPQKISTLAPGPMMKLTSMHEQLDKYENERALFSARLHQLMREARNVEVLQVNVFDTLHEGAEIRCGRDSFRPKSSITGPISIEYSLRTRKFSVSPYKSLALK